MCILGITPTKENCIFCSAYCKYRVEDDSNNINSNCYDNRKIN